MGFVRRMIIKIFAKTDIPIWLLGIRRGPLSESDFSSNFSHFIFLGELILPDWGTTGQEGQYTTDPSINETATDQVTLILYIIASFFLTWDIDF